MGGMKNREITAEERRAAAIQLGELAAESLGVFCWCNRCGHNAVIAIETLVASLGPDYPVPEVGTRLRCSSCGAKDVATRPAWPGLGQIARHG